MGFEQSAQSREWMARVSTFIDDRIVPAVPVYHQQFGAIDRRAEIRPISDALKAKAQAESLWNIFMPPSEHDDEYRGPRA